MKRILALLLFVCLTFPFVGSYGWLLLSKHLLKREIKQQILAGIEREQLVLLSFASADAIRELRWEHSREFAYRENMYDVVESAIREDSCFYLCYPDHRETALNRKIASLVEKCLGNSPVQQDNQKMMNRLLHLTYLCVHFYWQPSTLEAPYLQPCRTKQHCLSGVSDPPDHPPKA